MIEVTKHIVEPSGRELSDEWLIDYDEGEVYCGEHASLLLSSKETLIKSFIPWAPIKVTVNDIMDWVLYTKLANEARQEIDNEILDAIKIEITHQNRG